MRTISFIFASALLFLGPSMAGSADGGIPGIGTFEFSGLSTPTAAESPVVMAAIR